MRGDVLDQVSKLWRTGHEVILVHGGGRSLSSRLEQLGVPSRFVDGLRVTDEKTLEVALMVLAGQLNKGLVAQLAALQVRSAGLCGADGAAVHCEPVRASGHSLGFVGKPIDVDPSLFDLLLAHRILPVVSSIGLGSGSDLCNVNADQMSAACAWGAKCDGVAYLTDVPGVMDSKGMVRASITGSEFDELRSAGVISGGMLPKLQSCMEALSRGVPKAYILPGNSPGILSRLTEGVLQEGTLVYGEAK